MLQRAVTVLIIFTLLTTGFAGLGVAQESSPEENVRYDIHHNASTGVSNVTVAVTVSDTKEYGSWTLSWTLPNETTVTNIETSTSETVDSKRDGNSLEVKESDGQPRKSETFYITYTTTNRFETTKYGAITQLQGQLSALSSAPSYVELTVSNATIANTFRYTNHSVTTTPQTTRLGGTGPITFVTNIKHTNGTVETDDYAVYNANISSDTLNNSYAISTIGTGTIPQINQVPIVVLTEDNYEDRYGAVSAGQFDSGLIILSSKSLEDNRQLLPLLTHEYTHAITERVQPPTPARWFTEGISQYTESIARDKVKARQTTIDEDRFWDYHSNDRSWVETRWADTNEDRLRFAYAYSELVVKHSETENYTTVRSLFQSMATGETVVTQQTQPTVLYGNSWQGTVCSEQTRTQTVACAEETLQYIPSDTQPESYTTPFNRSVNDQNITIEQVTTPTPQPTPTFEESTSTSDTESPDANTSETTEATDEGTEPFDTFFDYLFKTIIEIVQMLIEGFVRWLSGFF